AIDCLLKGVQEFGWYEQKNRNKKTGRYRRGIGVACGSHPISYFNVHHDLTTMTLKMHEDGSLTLNTGLHDVGCGLITTIAQIVAEVWDLDPALINILEADTERGPFDIGTFASRNAYVGGACALQAAQKLKMLFLEQAAIILGTLPEYLAMAGGRVWIKGRENQKKTYGELATAILLQNQVDLSVTVTHRPPGRPVAYAAHFAGVEVDTATGLIRVTDYVAVHDVGKAINPGIVEGQILGGIQMGLGFALCEEIKIATDGMPLNASFRDYLVLNAPEMPDIRVFLIEAGEEGGPFGAKGVGEIATVPVAPAVVNAVNNALGTSLTALPLTPEKVLSSLRHRR
ncbi:MAG: molybdopterin-dependent oxidoreductase, partial [Moorella sp. (in: Bacteria)]|nr:molybdopterin-dependent oxidoreductase [Moorella sp. (in: firmicutes)]